MVRRSILVNAESRCVAMSSVKRAADAMNASLRREFKRIEALLRSAPEDVEVRHKVGLLVVALKRDSDRYGKQAVALVATALGRDEATLYRFAQVASRWTEAEVAHWVARAKAKGQPLSWWHFVEASAVARKRDRDELLRKTIDERLSVRAITRLAAGAGRQPRAMNRLVREVEGLVRRAATVREECASLRAVSSRVTLEAAAIERARTATHALVAEAERTRSEVEALAADMTAAGGTAANHDE